MPRRTRGFKWDNRLKKQYVAGTEITYGGTGGSITSTDNPPGSPQPGDTWFDTSTGSFYIYYDDGGSQQWVGVGGRIGATGPAGSGSGASSGSSSVSVSTTAPNSPTEGDMWFNSELLETYIYYNSQWVISNPSGGAGNSTFVSTTAPNSPTEGDMWFNSELLETYIYYNSQWVISNPSGGGGSGTTVYATLAELPLTNVTNGAQAFVSETDRLYIWADNGWYNIALINTSPTITQGGAGSYELATDGTPTVITLTATDPEGVPITWSYSVTSGSLSNGGGTTATVTQADNVFTITPTTTDTYGGTFELTFTASDGVNLATDTNSFSLVFVTLVQNSKYTSALITTDGTTGNNTTFTDSSSNALTITTAGTPSSQSFSPYRSGGYSVEIDASAGSWIQAQSHSDFAFGTGDFTVEFWMKSQKSDQWLLLIDQQYQAQGVSIWINPTNELVYYPNSSTPALTSQALTMSDWIHVALVRNSGTTKFYVNGVWNSTSYSDSQNFPTNLPLKMGSDYSAASYGYKGYFRDVRVTNTAVYSTNFTPPTEPLTEIAGTRLLTCQSLTFKDESTTPHTIGITGTPSIVPVGPYDYDEYNPSNHGGSIYFEEGDVLTAADNTIFDVSGAYTAEAWIYVDTFPSGNIGNAGQGFVMARWTANGDQRSWGIFLGADGALGLYHSATGNASYSTAIASAGSITQSAWHHVASTWDGTTMRLFVNGTVVASTADANGPYSTPNAGVTLNALNTSLTGTGIKQYITDARYIPNQALYTADFTPPLAPLVSTNTAIHIKGTGANIIDKSQTNTLTLVGNTTASTTQTKYASSSIYFDGTGDYLNTSSNNIFAMGTEDFTVECWVNKSDTGHRGIWQISSTSGGLQETNYVDTLALGYQIGKWQIYAAGGPSHVDGPSNSVSTNTWYHTAVVRNNGVTKLYLNGTEEISVTDTHNYTGTYLVIGGYYNTSYLHNGYIEDFRITKGLARYTANFTPPTGSFEG